MGIQAAPEVKFAIIREATRRDDNLLKISTMCRIAGVSRSGYYKLVRLREESAGPGGRGPQRLRPHP